MSIRRAVALLIFALMPFVTYGSVTRSLVNVPTRTGVTQQFLLLTPEAPVANLVVVRGFGTYPDAIHNGGAEPLFVTLLANSRIAVALVVYRTIRPPGRFHYSSGVPAKHRACRGHP